ncbi:MAG TPA: hypothetical protein VMD75_13740 [Candidatus Binataceae bacterium]|nr:hypothetical protein [Candidatus Binataceae bacterium]
MVKKLIIATLGLALSIGGGTMLLAAETSTVSGHLRDGFCYTIMGAHGASHHACALKCAKAGIPVLFVEDKTDKGYVLLPPKDDEGLPTDVTDKMEQEVTLTGHEYTKDGVSFFQVESVK